MLLSSFSEDSGVFGFIIKATEHKTATGAHKYGRYNNQID
jgi:hypothetical protein